MYANDIVLKRIFVDALTVAHPSFLEEVEGVPLRLAVQSFPNLTSFEYLATVILQDKICALLDEAYRELKKKKPGFRRRFWSESAYRQWPEHLTPMPKSLGVIRSMSVFHAQKHMRWDKRWDTQVQRSPAKSAAMPKIRLAAHQLELAVDTHPLVVNLGSHYNPITKEFKKSLVSLVSCLYDVDEMNDEEAAKYLEALDVYFQLTPYLVKKNEKKAAKVTV
jgi:hypothetical protein